MIARGLRVNFVVVVHVLREFLAHTDVPASLLALLREVDQLLWSLELAGLVLEGEGKLLVISELLHVGKSFS